MRINHKSDFDFRLDLYAADPYGSAIASGFPECDFTGKLFIGSSARSRQCYVFSKSGSKLVNCLNKDGHLHVVVSGHNLTVGPLCCELTLKLPDSNYPGGVRSVVYNFPLHIFLTDSDAELISPTVSVTLPVIQKTTSGSSSTDEPSDDNGDESGTVVSGSRMNGLFSEPWISQSVCGGHFRTGAFAGNVYRNDKGRIFISGAKEKLPDGGTLLTAYIPSLLNLRIRNLNIDNLIVSIHNSYDTEFDAQIDGNHLRLTCENEYFPGYYLNIEPSPYATISPDGSIKRYNDCPIRYYKPQMVTLDELHRHIEIVRKVQSNKVLIKALLKVSSKYKLQYWARQKRVRTYKRDTSIKYFTIWVKPKIRIMKWNTKHRLYENTNVRPIFGRIARKRFGRISDWLYFKILWLGGTLALIQTDETGASITSNFIALE